MAIVVRSRSTVTKGLPIWGQFEVRTRDEREVEAVDLLSEHCARYIQKRLCRISIEEWNI